MSGFKNSWSCTRENLAASLDTVEYYEDMNSLGNDFEPVNKKKKDHLTGLLTQSPIHHLVQSHSGT